MWGKIWPHIRVFAAFLQKSLLRGRTQKCPHLYAA